MGTTPSSHVEEWSPKAKMGGHYCCLLHRGDVLFMGGMFQKQFVHKPFCLDAWLAKTQTRYKPKQVVIA